MQELLPGSLYLSALRAVLRTFKFVPDKFVERELSSGPWKNHLCIKKEAFRPLSFTNHIVRWGITPHILCFALRVVLRTIKIVPDDFVELGSHPGLGKSFKHKKGGLKASLFMLKWRPQGDSNPCYRRERAVS